MEHDLASLHLKEVVPPLTEAKSHSRNEKKAGDTNGNPFGAAAPSTAAMLGVRTAHDLVGNIPPRAWLLGNAFCRRFISSIIAEGGGGKTALRIAQALSLAIGRSLTGEHVFERVKVLYVSLEDDMEELHRRVAAACLHHGVKASEWDGWLFLWAPDASIGKLTQEDEKNPRRQIPGNLATQLENLIRELGVSLVVLDPFVKAHNVEENSNSAIDEVLKVAADLSIRNNCAVELPHHVAKGISSDPGNANRGRGASAMKDAARLVFSLSPMTPEEATAFDVQEPLRRSLVRLDPAKVNLCPREDARWFRIVGVSLGNASDLYPHGDTIQTVECWNAPDAWKGTDSRILNLILDDIDKGMPDGRRYSDHGATGDRAVWPIFRRHLPDKGEGAAKAILKSWKKSRLVRLDSYDNPKRRMTEKGLFVDNSKRPT